jgi:hypothetical protein
MEYKLESHNKIISYQFLLDNHSMVSMYSYWVYETAERSQSFRDITTLLNSENSLFYMQYDDCDNYM